MAQPASGRRFSPVLGRVAGIPIRLHPTFFLLAFLALISTDPLAFAVTLVLVFGSVTVHELAHSVTAQRRGVVVRDILLLPIGGVSELERLPDRPHDQLMVAAAGPATSVAIGLASLALNAAWGGDLLPVDLVSGALLHRLGWLNLVLGGFNLVPALPLDGGRVLRAFLATRIGGAKATLAAARLGRLLGAAMIAFGVLYDVWLAFIGLFVLSGAAAEEAAAVMAVRLEGVSVLDLMHPLQEVGLAEYREIIGPDAVVVAADEPVSEAVGTVARSGHDVAAVVRDGEPIGVLRLRDVAAAVNDARPRQAE